MMNSMNSELQVKAISLAKQIYHIAIAEASRGGKPFGLRQPFSTRQLRMALSMVTLWNWISNLAWRFGHRVVTKGVLWNIYIYIVLVECHWCYRTSPFVLFCICFMLLLGIPYHQLGLAILKSHSIVNIRNLWDQLQEIGLEAVVSLGRLVPVDTCLLNASMQRGNSNIEGVKVCGAFWGCPPFEQTRPMVEFMTIRKWALKW